MRFRKLLQLQSGCGFKICGCGVVEVSLENFAIYKVCIFPPPFLHCIYYLNVEVTTIVKWYS